MAKEIIRLKANKPKRRITIEVDEETLQLIQELKSLQPHIPAVIKAALEDAIIKAKKQKFKTTKKSHRQMAVPSERAIKRGIFT